MGGGRFPRFRSGKGRDPVICLASRGGLRRHRDGNFQAVSFGIPCPEEGNRRHPLASSPEGGNGERAGSVPNHEQVRCRCVEIRVPCDRCMAKCTCVGIPGIGRERETEGHCHRHGGCRGTDQGALPGVRRMGNICFFGGRETGGSGAGERPDAQGCVSGGPAKANDENIRSDRQSRRSEQGNIRSQCPLFPCRQERHLLPFRGRRPRPLYETGGARSEGFQSYYPP